MYSGQQVLDELEEANFAGVVCLYVPVQLVAL